MPQNPYVIATKTPTSDVLIFDYTKHPSKPGIICETFSVRRYCYQWISWTTFITAQLWQPCFRSVILDPSQTRTLIRLETLVFGYLDGSVLYICTYNVDTSVLYVETIITCPKTVSAWNSIEVELLLLVSHPRKIFFVSFFFLARICIFYFQPRNMYFTVRWS